MMHPNGKHDTSIQDEAKASSGEQAVRSPLFWSAPRVLLVLSLPLAFGLWLLGACAVPLADPWGLFLSGMVRLYFYATMVGVLYLHVKRFSSAGRYDTWPMLLDVVVLLVVQAILWHVK